jgi:uncharacterized membrane-anchored protein
MRSAPTERRGRGRDSASMPGVGGVARLDRRVPKLLDRLNPGEIAIIDFADLDRATADALVQAKVSAVVNVQPSITGRYPNLGPEVLVSNGILLLDAVGPDVFSQLKDGAKVRISGNGLYAGDKAIAFGTALDADAVALAMVNARVGLAAQLENFGAAVQQHMQRERDLLLDGVGIPNVSVKFKDRHVLLVAKGYDYKADLKALKHYIREFSPILVGVDAGADVLVEAGYTPDLVIGELDEISVQALREAKEVVAHADFQGRVTGLARVQDLNVDLTIFPSAGSSEDAAMMLANHGGARLIVTVGIRATIEELLDSAKGSMASAVLTRLKMGGKVVDAKAAVQLFQTRISGWTMLLLVGAAMLAVTVVLLTNNGSTNYLTILSDGWDHLFARVKDLLS